MRNNLITRSILHLSICLLALTAKAQEWKTLDSDDYGMFSWTRNGYAVGNRLFKVNPHDGSIWCDNRNIIHGIDKHGEYFRFDEENCYIIQPFNQGSNLAEFAFTRNDTYVCDKFNGIIKYNGNNWSYLYHGEWMKNIFAEEDTVYALFDQSSEVRTWINGSPGETFHPLFGHDRISVKNGKMYGSTSIPRGTLSIPIENGYYLYDPDSCMILDRYNFDIKHSPNSDLLFVAHENGISVAKDGVFYDTITSNNSWGMPGGAIAEIEVDSQDNIWALFGELSNNGYSFSGYYSIAYYNSKTRAWSNIFSVNNSPLELLSNVSIDLGPYDNLYIADYDKLHIVKFGDQWPVWMDVAVKLPKPFSIGPNPTSDLLKIFGNQYGLENEIVIRDQLMREVKRTPFSHQIDVSELAAGSYWLELLKESEPMERTQFVKL